MLRNACASSLQHKSLPRLFSNLSQMIHMKDDQLWEISFQWLIYLEVFSVRIGSDKRKCRWDHCWHKWGCHSGLPYRNNGTSAVDSDPESSHTLESKNNQTQIRTSPITTSFLWKKVNLAYHEGDLGIWLNKIWEKQKEDNLTHFSKHYLRKNSNSSDDIGKRIPVNEVE